MPSTLGIAPNARAGGGTPRPGEGPLEPYRRRPQDAAAGAGPAAFVKHGDPDALAREAAVLEHLAASGGSVLAPRPLHRLGGTLEMELLAGHASLHDLVADDLDERLGRALGTRLAELHGLHVGELPPAFDPVPETALTPADAAALPQAVLELTAVLQRTDGLPLALDKLRAALVPTALIHGDVKLDNAMARPTQEAVDVVLVDFEHAGAGDPAWDVGAAVGDHLSRWVLSAPTDRDRPLAERLAAAPVGLHRAAASARALLEGYGAVRGLPARDTIARCAGVFLLHRAQVWVERHGRLGARPTLLVRAGAGLVLGGRAALDPLLAA